MDENHDTVITMTERLSTACETIKGFAGKLDDIANRLTSLETEVRVKERVWSWIIGIGVPAITFCIGLFWNKR